MKTRSDCILRRSADFRLVVSRDFESEIRALGLLDGAGFEAALAVAPRVPGGRGHHRVLGLPNSDESVRLRPLRHGGVLANRLGDRFLRPHRAFREFEIWLALRERGVSLPRPVLAVSRRKGPFWRSALASIDRKAARDAAEWLQTRPDPERFRATCVAFARTLRDFHDAGGLHGDLHLGNILVEITAEPERPQCWLIDLDRTRILSRVSARRRMRELVRLVRSFEKTGRLDLLSPRVRALTLSAYCGGDRDLRSEMGRSIAGESRRIRRHRLAWWIGKRVGHAALAMLLAFTTGCRAGSDDSQPSPRADSRWSILATGDTGRTSLLPEIFEGQLSVAHAMIEEARRDPVDGVVLLGDNFYWHGLEREHLVERIRTNLVRPYCYFLDLDGPRSNEVREACAIPRQDRSPVPILAVLGNHDLESPEGVALERHAIPEFLPDWKMSGTLAEAVEIGPGVSLILFESEIAIDDEEAIRRALRSAIDRARGPWLILATHRPIATDDLGNLPVGGYPGFVTKAIAESGRRVQLVLAGHHHNMQVFELEAPTASLQIGIGSGSRALPPLARNHPHARFGTIELGFARVDLLGQGVDERLSVSLFQTSRWPWLARLRPARLRARFEVDREGIVTRQPSNQGP